MAPRLFRCKCTTRLGALGCAVLILPASCLGIADHPFGLNNRGLAYVRMGKPERARRDFESVLRIDQQFAPARRNLESLRDEVAPP